MKTPNAINQRVIISLGCAMALSGCGYHLRDQQLVPPSLSDLYVDCPASVEYPVCQNLVKRLNRQNIAIDTNEQARYHLNIRDIAFNRRAISISNKAIAAEYEVSLTASIALLDSLGTRYLDNTGIAVSRTYRFNEVTVLSKEREETLVRNELSQMLGDQIVRRLSPFTEKHLVNLRQKQSNTYTQDRN